MQQHTLSIFNVKRFSDQTVKVYSDPSGAVLGTFYLHRAFLLRCTYFKMCFDAFSGWRDQHCDEMEIRIPDFDWIDGDTLSTFFRMLYIDEIDEERHGAETLLKLHKLACFFGNDIIRQFCTASLSVQMGEDNAVDAVNEYIAFFDNDEDLRLAADQWSVWQAARAGVIQDAPPSFFSFCIPFSPSPTDEGSSVFMTCDYIVDEDCNCKIKGAGGPTIKGFRFWPNVSGNRIVLSLSGDKQSAPSKVFVKVVVYNRLHTHTYKSTHWTPHTRARVDLDCIPSDFYEAPFVTDGVNSFAFAVTVNIVNFASFEDLFNTVAKEIKKV